MLCASTYANITASTGSTPGIRSTRATGSRSPEGRPGASGRLARTHAISASVSAVTPANVARQPSAAPSAVPSGMPTDIATGAPSIAIAIARPRCRASTIRLA
ncbi:Uncharacterised protein [Burkholderia pseudomallei]|nr:hypothetical protein DM46_5023 [Burkholderia mallei]CAJ8246590.1 Uncharacterised protein [Burkholderia pseudomallei]